jgi:hypothetical protein
MNEKLSILPPLLAHSQSFFMNIQRGLPIVDKTKTIQLMLNNYVGPYFLARPRKFGKSFLLDTIHHIAKGDPHLFSKLDIGQPESGYEWRPFSVIRLDLSNVSSDPDHFSNSLNDLLVHKCEILGINIPPAIAPERTFSRLIEGISRFNPPLSLNPDFQIHEADVPQNVVLLIDEYNMPLVRTLGNSSDTEDIRGKLHDFYSVIKTMNDYFRFVLITGVTRFDQLSVLSGLNNLNDITLDPVYSQICGFSKEEIKSIYLKYLVSTLDAMKARSILNENSTLDDFIYEMEKWYKGYSWDGNNLLFNPYSILKCFNSKIFSDFWYQSFPQYFIHRLGLGMDSYYTVFSKGLLLSKEFDDPSLVANTVISDIHNIINENEILFQAGYLTIDAVDIRDAKIEYSLRIPNNEIREAIIKQFIARMTVPIDFGTKEKFVNKRYKDFFDSFCTLDVSKAEELFTSFITSVPFYYSITKEWVYCVLLYYCLNIGQYRPINESVMIKGRTDLVLQTPANDWIIVEVKHEKPGNHETEIDTTDAGKCEVPDESIRVLSLDTKKVGTVNDRPVILTDLSLLPAPGVPSGEIFPMNLTDAGNRSLDKNIKRAFDQIVNRRYSAPYFGGNEKIYAAAVAIYYSSFVRIRFQRVVWKDFDNQKTECIKTPEN